MKKILGISCGLLLLVALTNSSVALLLEDYTYFDADGADPAGDLVYYGGSSVNLLEGFGDYLIWQHNFEFSPPAETVSSGQLTVWLRDDEPDAGLFTREFAFGFAEDGSWDFGPVDTGSYDYMVNASSLTDGEFLVAVVSFGGDFYVDQSRLVIDYEPVEEDPAVNPEPGTLIMLGTGLVGLAGYGRLRIRRRKKV